MWSFHVKGSKTHLSTCKSSHTYPHTHTPTHTRSLILLRIHTHTHKHIHSLSPLPLSPSPFHVYTHSNTLPHTLQHTATHRHTLQHTAAHWDSLQHNATTFTFATFPLFTRIAYSHVRASLFTPIQVYSHTYTLLFWQPPSVARVRGGNILLPCTGGFQLQEFHAHSSIFAYIHISALPRTLQHTATHCNTLQHTATHCSTLRLVATHCNHPFKYTRIHTHQHTLTHGMRLFDDKRVLLCAKIQCIYHVSHTHSHVHTHTHTHTHICTRIYTYAHAYTDTVHVLYMTHHLGLAVFARHCGLRYSCNTELITGITTQSAWWWSGAIFRAMCGGGRDWFNLVYLAPVARSRARTRSTLLHTPTCIDYAFTQIFTKHI